jgi:hypothetical protein
MGGAPTAPPAAGTPQAAPTSRMVDDPYGGASAPAQGGAPFWAR